MALLNKILKWTKTLPIWQQDAARRLLQNEKNLTELDYKELYLLMKAENGIDIPNELHADPLAPKHLPAEAKPDKTVIIKAMRELRNVNRIAPDQILEFNITGITVIYGGNSTGKSGYARVLKSACRARDQSERVHPDVNNIVVADAIPTAKFDIDFGGNNRELYWTRDDVPPDELSLISVFDSKCARSYLTSEQDVAYLPYGLDIVENLANKVLPNIKMQLDEEISNIDTEIIPFEHLYGQTEVGKQIQKLSEKTDPEIITKLATLNNKEKKRLEDLNKALGDSDPQSKAKNFQLSALRIKALAEHLKAHQSLVDQKLVDNLRKLDQAKLAAEEMELKAAEALQAGEDLLPGTGEEVWKLLFDVARKFSTEVAYPDEEFPFVGKNARCLLCQEVIQESTRKRLIRFEQYIKDDVAKNTQVARKNFELEKMNFERVDINLKIDKTLMEEIQALDDSLPKQLKEFEANIVMRWKSIVASLESHNWSGITEIGWSPHSQLRNLAAQQLRAFRTFSQVTDEEARKRLVIEHNELSARFALSKSLNAILALLGRMKAKANLKKCYRQLKTRPISDKSKELASATVTNELKKALDSELLAINMKHIKTKLKERNERGRMLHQLILDLPTANRIEDILSEGEQRALAIASFLAELSLADHRCGIVFDDPVSSLDHWRRKNVAERLVQEALKHRQVIIFTHDTSFLGQLCDEIEKHNAPHSMYFLEWRGDNPGYVNIGLPWDHQGYKERIDILERAQRKLAKSWPAYPGETESRQMRQLYDRLRATLERVIQDVVFNGVVKRYRDWIRVDSLAGVVGFQESEYKAIDALHKRCSDVVTAHDPSSSKLASVPTAAELGVDIAELTKIIESIKSRRKVKK